MCSLCIPYAAYASNLALVAHHGLLKSLLGLPGIMPLQVHRGVPKLLGFGW